MFVYIPTQPCVEDGYVYVGDHRNAVYALYSDNGQSKWRYDTGGVVESSPVVDKGTVYVGSYDGKLYALDAELGDLKWTFTVRASLVSGVLGPETSPAPLNHRGDLQVLDRALNSLRFCRSTFRKSGEWGTLVSPLTLRVTLRFVELHWSEGTSSSCLHGHPAGALSSKFGAFS